MRPRLLRIAYRMLGSLAEAEDIVQDAWLRWSRADRDEVSNPAAFLSRTVTRLCLDHLKSARVKRESYVGFWLPEPLIEVAEEDGAVEAEDVSLTLMLALERLSPLERAAFLLHDVFDMPFAEVARAIGRDEAACRQLAARARAHVRSERPRYPLKGNEGEAIARAFFDAVARNDAEGLKAMLSENVVAYADGGGKKPAHLNPIYGRDKVLRLIAGLAAKPGDPPRWVQAAVIDGLPGFVAFDRWGTLQTTALAIEDGRVAAFYTMRNPDKLARVEDWLAREPRSGPGLH
ncbi:sigma-70 family RNA polymerase sigma factor [Alsobacter sp. KACC 23698]